MLGWIREKMAAARAAEEARVLALEEQRTLLARIEARFPPSVLFRIPPEMQRFDDSGTFVDDPLDPQWSAAMRTFPQPPQTESERQRREDQFWRACATFHTVTNPDGSKEIKARGALEDYFRRNELWVFRFYYAATGIVNQTIFKEQCRLYLKLRKSLQKSESANSERHAEGAKLQSVFRKGNYNSGLYDVLAQHSDKADARLESLGEQWETFIAQTIPAHHEKWCGWYSSHILEAYRKGQQPQQKPKGNVYGEGGFANLGDVQAAQGRPDMPHHGAQSQTFGD